MVSIKKIYFDHEEIRSESGSVMTKNVDPDPDLDTDLDTDLFTDLDPKHWLRVTTNPSNGYLDMDQH